MGRSRGGLTTKIHALVDANGLPIALKLTEGQAHDGRRAEDMKPAYKSKEQYKQVLDGHVARLSELQRLLYASNRYAVLLIFQGMDAVGKDGAIRHVMSGVNPQGCQVFSFKHASAAELRHDFLWRMAAFVPAMAATLPASDVLGLAANQRF